MQNPFEQDIQRLRHIVSTIDEIQGYMKRDRNDKAVERAMERCFEIIGEAAKHISADIVLDYPDVPWRRMRDFRNLLSHEYWRVDSIIMWQTAEHELTGLKQDILKILSDKGQRYDQ